MMEKRNVLNHVSNFKVKGQGHEVKKVKKACEHDSSKSTGLIWTKISGYTLLGMGRN